MVGVDDHRAETAASAGAVALSLPARAQYIRLARLVGSGMANELGLGLDGLDDVRLAIGEACALAVHDDATEIHLSYEFAGDTLTVSGDAPRSVGGRSDADDEQLSLVEQILGVACSDYEIRRDEHGLSFRLTFTDRR
jgi:serine/threonine-protein kinase RsbW